MSDTNDLTPVQLELLAELMTCGCQVRSLFALAVHDMGIAYPHAHRCVTRLERAGLIAVERRGPGAALHIRLSDPLARFVTGCDESGAAKDLSFPLHECLESGVNDKRQTRGEE